MRNKAKVGRNDPCPCGSIEKFKHCCEGKVAWEPILRSGSEKDWLRNLSVRGRNALFLGEICDALQLDREPQGRTLAKFKAAFTPGAVRKIHEAIVKVWPPDIVLQDVLARSRTEVSGLYVGEYESELLLRGVARHALYANKILLVDPFVYPMSVRDEFNAILHPEQFRSQTLRNVDMWFHMMPWLKSGIVEFIRTPNDFDRRLNWDSLVKQQQKFEDNEELKQALEETVDAQVEKYKEREGQRMLLLSAPDNYLRRIFKEQGYGNATYTADDFINYINKLRKDDPFYLEPFIDERGRSSEFHIKTSGASYEIAKLTAAMTGSYLVTDLPSRWKEIELDRQTKELQSRDWSALAKAFHGLQFKYLNNVEIQHAVDLRQGGHLSKLRAFLHRVWTAASSEDSYAPENVQHLADELKTHIAEAEYEWAQIDRDLVKSTGGVGAGLVAAGQMIESGQAIFLAAAFAVAGAASLVSNTLQRRDFPNKHPAAFFMKLDK